MDEAKEQFKKHLEEERAEMEARGEEVPADHDDAPFNEAEFNEKFDEENPPIVIPEEVQDDIDNDYNIPEPVEEEQE